jgi:hypothetical protein
LTIAAMNLSQAVSPLLIRLGRSRASRLHATRRLVSNLDLERQCGLLAAKYLDRALVRRDAISERRIAIVERRLGLLLPEALRAYYWVAGRAAALNTAHNQLLYPEDLGVEDNHLMFMDENQSVVSWGFRLADLAKADPVVWQRNNTAPVEWHSERKSFTRFMESMFRWYRSAGIWH